MRCADADAAVEREEAGDVVKSTSVHVCRVGSFRSRLTVRKKTVGGWGRWEGGTQGQRGRKGRGREGQGRHGVRGPAEAKPTSSPFSSSSSLSELCPRAMTPSEKTPCKHAQHGTARHSTARSSAAQRNAAQRNATQRDLGLLLLLLLLPLTLPPSQPSHTGADETARKPRSHKERPILPRFPAQGAAYWTGPAGK